MALTTFLAFLRGINVGGHNRIPMAELRSLCGELGWAGVRTYIASGNIIFQADERPSDLEKALELAVTDRFGCKVTAIVRSGTEWSVCVRANPFPTASLEQPNLVMLALSKDPPNADAEATLQSRAVNGERVRRVGDALWIHYAGGAGQSKLFPGLLDRAVGSAVTTRNWRTVLMLDQLCSGSP